MSGCRLLMSISHYDCFTLLQACLRSFNKQWPPASAFPMTANQIHSTSNVSHQLATNDVGANINVAVLGLRTLFHFWTSFQHLFSMLSQFDNEHHKNHIRRSKSTTSVKERRKHPITSEPLDPESARVHAVIAAHRAMDRSRGSSEADLYRSDSSASKQSARLARGRHAANQSDPATRLQRQRSLLQATTPNLAATLPLPGGGNTARGGPQSSTHTSVSEFGGSYEGEPSSYRRLRKAKSVLNPSHG